MRLVLVSICALGVLAAPARAEGHLLIRALALTGGVAPDALGEYVQVGGPVHLSSAGHVGFWAAVSSARGGFVRDPAGGFSTTLVGDASPPALLGDGYSLVGAPDVAASGDRVFQARGNEDASQIGWVLEADGTPAVIALAGDPIPGVAGATWGWNPSDAEINDAGQVLLFSRFQDAGDPNALGLFRIDGSGVSLLVRTGDVAPDAGGETYESIEESLGRSFDDAGDVAFSAGLAGSSRRGVFRYEGDGSGVTRIALELDPSPVAGRVYTFPNVGDQAINEYGDVAFVAALEDALQVGHDTILLHTDAGDAVVLEEGQPTPGADGFSFASFASLALADDRTIAFIAISDSADAGAPSRDGVYRVRNGVVSALATQGDPAPQAGGATFEFFSVRSVRIDDRGEITFHATLSDGRAGVFLAVPASRTPVLGAPGAVVLGLLLLLAGIPAARAAAPQPRPRACAEKASAGRPPPPR